MILKIDIFASMKNHKQIPPPSKTRMGAGERESKIALYNSFIEHSIYPENSYRVFGLFIY